MVAKPLIVRFAELQNRHQALTDFCEFKVKPFLESASLLEAHPCIRGDCEHHQAERWKCRVALIDLIKESAERARKILAP